MCRPKAPKAPDYRGAAEEQAKGDQWQTRYQTAANRPNMYTPWGTSQWTNEMGPDGMPNWSQNITLSPSEQAQFDSQQRISQGRTDIAEQMMRGQGPQLQPALDESGEPIIGEDGQPVMQEGGGMGSEMMTPGGFWDNLSPGGYIPQTFGVEGLPQQGYMPQQRPMEQLPGMGGMPQGSQMGRLPGMADYSQFAGLVGGPGDQSNEGMLPGYDSMTGFQQTGPSRIQMGLQDRGEFGGGEYDPRFAEAQYGREMSMLGPQQEAAMAAQESALRNQGLRPGTQAYDSALQNLRTQQGEEQSRLRQSSVLRGADEQQRQFGRDLSQRQQNFGEGLQGGQFANQAAGQQFGQNMAMADQAAQLRGQQFGELNQLAQLRGGGQEAQFQRAMQLAGAQNQLRGQEFGQQMDYGNQQFGQQMGQAQLQDARRGQEFGQQMAYGSRDFGEQMQQAQLAQQMRGQEFGQQMAYGGQQFDQQMQQSNYMNQLRQQEVAEQMQREGWSLNKINALLSGQQVGMPQMPSFAQATKAQGPQYLTGANYAGNFDMSAYEANVSQSNAMWDALGSIGGGLAMGSDPALKEDVQELASGTELPLYKWHWNEKANEIGLSGEQIGFMVPDVERNYPQHIVEIEGGYKGIDYKNLADDLRRAH